MPLSDEDAAALIAELEKKRELERERKPYDGKMKLCKLTWRERRGNWRKKRRN